MPSLSPCRLLIRAKSKLAYPSRCPHLALSALSQHLPDSLSHPSLEEDQGASYYQCQCCGNCCKWPGDIWITEEEIPKIARFVGFSPLEFIERFTRLTNNRRGLSIIDKPNGECVFLEGNECTIQPVKPPQCSGFPNDWNFPGWQDICEAIPMSSDHQPLGIPREAKAKRASSPSEKGNAS